MTQTSAAVIDFTALQAWCATHVDGLAGAWDIESFEGGQSNPTYRIRSAEGCAVLRTKPAPAAALLP